MEHTRCAKTFGTCDHAKTFDAHGATAHRRFFYISTRVLRTLYDTHGAIAPDKFDTWSTRGAHVEHTRSTKTNGALFPMGVDLD